MKKKFQGRIVLFALLLTCSLGAHSYLNHPSRQETAIKPSLERSNAFERYERVPSGDPLPDLQVLRKLLEIGKKLIPAQ